jgi:hypothetical protein
MKKIFSIAILLISILVGPTSADVTLTFETDTQGFSTVGWNAANGGVAWSPNHGGSLAVTINTAGWTNPVGFISMTEPLLAPVFNQALTNGGMLTFDFIIRQEDFIGYNTPQWFELVLVANTDAGVGGGWDQNVIGGSAGFYGGIPSGYTTVQVSIGIQAGPPDGNNGFLDFGVGSGWNELMIGVNSQAGSFTGATFYLDNMHFSAVPEPGSAFVLGAMVMGLFLRRSRFQ